MPITIDKGSKYFNTVTYAGAGTTTQAVTGVGFSPDFIWIKNRSDAYSHVLQDICRGFGATKNLASNSTNAEGASGATGDNYGHVSTSDSDGFTVTHTINGSNDGGTIRKGTHYSGDNYVGWCWDANGAGVSNTAGTITSTVSANTTSGFSIVSYTGNGTTNATVGHGLGVTPKMIITKNRSNATATNWTVYHASLSTNNQITLNQTDAQNLPSPLMVTTVGSSTYTLGSSRREINQSSDTYIAYCFAEVKGYSKFGKFISNGSDNGTFTYCGFKPAWVMMKPNVSDGWSHWYIFDNKRDLHNLTDLNLQANTSDADNYGGANYAQIDMLSNGFKIRRDSNWGLGGSGTEVFYMAFAENPFVTSKGIPTTAR